MQFRFTSFFLFLGLLLTVSSNQAQAQTTSTKEAIKFQKKLNKQFRSAKHSPLTEEDRDHFTELDFFPLDPDYRVEATWVPTPEEETFDMPTSNTDRQKPFLKYGELHFTLKGQQLKINVYQSQKLIQQKKYKDHLFIPFTDLTTGNDAYGGGRYIDWEIPKAGNPIILDFNQCYNPYCAYSTGWSCPIPPEENFLDIRIEAGVKAWPH